MYLDSCNLGGFELGSGALVMAVRAAVIVDSRNVFHQTGDAVGMRVLPRVPGVKAALARYGFEVEAVHVGLALARSRDQEILSRSHSDNRAYRAQIVSDGGDVLLGELHCKPSGAVEEKMVDCSCCVRITRYVDEIAHRRSSVQSIVVLSKDVDLRPAVDYAVSMSVPIVVAAHDVVQHRGHPFLLLGPCAYADLAWAQGLATGHERRDSPVRLLMDGESVPWTVAGTTARPKLIHAEGVVAVPADGIRLPRKGATVSLFPVDVTWQPDLLGAFPVLVCGTERRRLATWSPAKVRRRAALMTLEVKRADGSLHRAQFVQGGVVPGESVLIHGASGRVIGSLPGSADRVFDPDVPQVLRVISSLPNGGALAADSAGHRGLLVTDQKLTSGAELPGVQIDLKPKGPVWAAVGTPLQV